MSAGDWPHDPDGEQGSEGMRKYGHAVIAKRIDEDEDFPLSTSEFVAEHGDEPVRLNHETVVPLREIFEHVEGEEFDDMVTLHRAIGRGMREAGLWDYEGAETFVTGKSG